MERVGLIVPSSNVVIEDTLQSGAAPRGIRFHVARLPVVDVTLQAGSTGQFADDGFDAATGQVAEADVARFVFAGTAGAWLGIGRDRDWVRRTQAATQRPATTTTLKVLAALRATAPARIGLVTPFTEDVHGEIARNFGGEGFPVAAGRHLGLTLSRDMADVPPAEIAGLVEACADEGCDTVLTFCTNFRGADAAALVRPGVAVLDSVALTLA